MANGKSKRKLLPDCLRSVGSEEPVLPQLSSVEVSLIGDEEIARVHSEFLEDPTPTDVITFHHGEILISVDTAEREGPLHENSLEEEDSPVSDSWVVTSQRAHRSDRAGS